jgi:uncharacterized protein DUF4058
MPVHDWTRVPDGTFHHFHVAWIPMLADVLNEGVLPNGYYAMAEQVAGIIPDVLTLQAIGDDQELRDDSSDGGGTTLVTSPPRATVTARLELERSIYAAKANHLVIRHQSHDRVVAILEVVSPGNKSSRAALDQFLKKATASLWERVHLLVIDLHPPTHRDPGGIHGVIWEALGGEKEYHRPPSKPLTLAAYSAYAVDAPIEAFVEPIAVGDSLPPMPLFLATRRHVNVPLEGSYMTAVSKIPQRARTPLEA